MSKKRWYILRVSSGFESRTYKVLKQNKDFEDIYSPIELVKKLSGNKIIEKDNSLVKGYIWVKCVITDEILDFIKNTRFVVGFLGGEKNPQFTPDSEMEAFINKSKEIASQVKHVFSVGDRVKVCQGSFKSFSGIVQSIDTGNCTANISLRILGKETTVNIGLSEIKKED